MRIYKSAKWIGPYTQVHVQEIAPAARLQSKVEPPAIPAIGLEDEVRHIGPGNDGIQLRDQIAKGIQSHAAL